MPSLVTSLRALRELGLAQSAAYARYQLLKRSGWLWRQSRRAIESARRAAPPAPALGVFPLPEPAQLRALLSPDSLAQAGCRAEAICAGQVSLFEAPPTPLYFTLPVPLGPWPQHETQTWIPLPASGEGRGMVSAPLGNFQGLDIKFLWEPARFGWAVHLARAAHLSGDPDGKYRAAFWAHTERFLVANPPGFGPNWASAQEVAIRLISLCLAWEVFGPASTPQQGAALAAALGAHAARIPPSLDYARAQNNNHRLSEAAGLYTAGLCLPGHPQAARWRQLGWAEFHAGLLSQVSPSGEYCQHSANYHRLMLQLALWVQALAARAGDHFPAESQVRLDAAARWLTALLDETSGSVPNLGPNDGAYILPLASAPYRDFRPVLQSAWRAFSGRPLLSPAEWDEMCAWFTLLPASEETPVEVPLPADDESQAAVSLPISEEPGSPPFTGGVESQAEDFLPANVGLSRYSSPASEEPGAVAIPDGGEGHVGLPHTLRTSTSWGYLRAAHFNSRPGHADQLHFDLWWRGLNLALDAGTFLYNAPPPWDNRLVSADQHNTLTVDGQDQMQRAGRFLYLAPAQAEVTERLCAPDGRYQRLTARHHGYASLGVLHVRSVSTAAGEYGDQWLVEDQVVAARWLLPPLSRRSEVHRARLHWLLPDLPWALEPAADGWSLVLEAPYGPVRLNIQSSPPGALTLCRAGERLAGEGETQPVSGWFSPNYGQVQPALSLAVSTEGALPVSFSTRWVLPP